MSSVSFSSSHGTSIAASSVGMLGAKEPRGSTALSAVSVTDSPHAVNRGPPSPPAVQGSSKKSFSMTRSPSLASNSVSPSQPAIPQSLQQPSVDGERKSVSKSLTSMLRGLFRSNSKPSTDGSSPEARSSHSTVIPGQLNPARPPAKDIAPKLSSSQIGLHGLDLPSAIQGSGKSSRAQLEGEVAAAMKRAASITGRQAAPSTLLVMATDVPRSMTRPVWNLRDYTILEKMYTGYASNVYKAMCKFSGETVCLKAYALGNLCELNRFQIFREVKLHSSLSHEHIIRLYGAFQQADQVVLVQEYADAGDLFSLLHKYGGKLPERTAVELVLHPFLLVVNYLHTNGIAHRDIKPENILFTADMRLKLCDFGLAINMREERAVTRAGTLEYMSPEVLNCPFKNRPDENKENSSLHYSYHVDTWAVGVLTYELLVGLPPFSDNTRSTVEAKIRMEMPRFPSKMSDHARAFISEALEKDPLERPSVADMLNHRWIRTLRRSSSVRQIRGAAGPAAASGLPHYSSIAEQDDAEDDPAMAALMRQYIKPPSPKPVMHAAPAATLLPGEASSSHGGMVGGLPGAYPGLLGPQAGGGGGGGGPSSADRSVNFALAPGLAATPAATSQSTMLPRMQLKAGGGHSGSHALPMYGMSSAKSFTAGALPKSAFQSLVGAEGVGSRAGNTTVSANNSGSFALLGTVLGAEGYPTASKVSPGIMAAFARG